MYLSKNNTIIYIILKQNSFFTGTIKFTMKSIKHLRNIHTFFFIAFVFFFFAADWQVFPDDKNPDDTQLLRKVSRPFIKVTIDTSANLDEAANHLGISRDELVRLCTILSINIDRFLVNETAHSSIQKLRSPDFHPEPLVLYEGDSHYVIIVEKSAHKLYLLSYKNGIEHLAGVFDCKTGKIQGDKQTEGDEKTPEGIYFFVTKYSRNDITSMVGKGNAYEYGDLAYVTNYPNYFDRINNKNGSGIWLHGTDEPFFETSSLDTRGCVVTTNETIRELEVYIKLKDTPIIIVQDLTFISTEELKKRADNIHLLLDNWRNAWQEERLNDYINFYSPKFHAAGRNRDQLKNYKAKIAEYYDINHILIDNIVALKHKNGMIVRFLQDYSASNLSSIETKSLYFLESDGRWEIVTELIEK